MALLLIIIVCIIIGFLLARSRFSKPIDDAAAKAKGVFVNEPQVEADLTSDQGDRPGATEKE